MTCCLAAVGDPGHQGLQAFFEWWRLDGKRGTEACGRRTGRLVRRNRSPSRVTQCLVQKGFSVPMSHLVRDRVKQQGSECGNESAILCPGVHRRRNAGLDGTLAHPVSIPNASPLCTGGLRWRRLGGFLLYEVGLPPLTRMMARRSLVHSRVVWPSPTAPPSTQQAQSVCGFASVWDSS